MYFADLEKIAADGADAVALFELKDISEVMVDENNNLLLKYVLCPHKLGIYMHFTLSFYNMYDTNIHFYYDTTETIKQAAF